MGAAWVIDPQARGVRVHASADEYRTLGARDTLAGEGQLAGFAVPVARLFE